MKQKLCTLLLAVLALTLAGCGKKTMAEKIEYVPFQSESEGKWGLIGLDGKVLFADEFENAPTIALNGRFFVKNKEDEWEMYGSDEKPKQIGDAFKGICDFTEDVTPAVKNGGFICLVDRDGKTVKELKKLSGKSVQRVSRFVGGFARFETAEGYFGVINTSGDVVVEPNYVRLTDFLDGRFIAIDKKYEQAVKDDNVEKVHVTLLDGSGKAVSDFSHKKFKSVEERYGFGMIVACAELNDEEHDGLIDEKGEWVFKPTSKVKSIYGLVAKDKFIFSDGEKVGLMSTEGETLIRAKYDVLYSAGDKNILFAQDASKDENERWQLIDLEGNAVGTERFAVVSYFLGADHICPVQIGKNDWGLLKTNGELLPLKGVSLANVGFGWADSYVESDYVDTDALVSALNIQKNGMLGITIGMSAKEGLAAAHAVDPDVSTEATSHTYSSSINFSKEIKPAEVRATVEFTENIAKMLSHEETENYYGYTFSHTVYDGYGFSPATVSVVGAQFDNDGKLKGKIGDIYSKLTAAAKKLGKEVKHNENALIVDAGNDVAIVVIKNKKQACIIIGSNKGSLEDIDISQFASGGTEDLSFDNAEDDVAVDTAVVDY